MDQTLIRRLVEMEDIVVPALFKPVQFNILKKINACKELTENEKRYLRGNMKDKLAVLIKLISYKDKEIEDYTPIFNVLGSYYITGLEALKHNGFGWYFKTKKIEVINTKIEGNIHASNKILSFIRVKSIKNSKFSVDKETELKYADNEQIIKDIKLIKNKYAEAVWKQMFSRYGRLFVKDYNKFKSYLQKNPTLNYEMYGV